MPIRRAYTTYTIPLFVLYIELCAGREPHPRHQSPHKRTEAGYGK